jgi:hypothetical protein
LRQERIRAAIARICLIAASGAFSGSKWPQSDASTCKNFHAHHIADLGAQAVLATYSPCHRMRRGYYGSGKQFDGITAPHALLPLLTSTAFAKSSSTARWLVPSANTHAPP